MTSAKDCEACGSATKVYKTVICDEGVKRTRQCLACNVRYDTIETRMVICDGNKAAPDAPAVTYDQYEATSDVHKEEHYDEFGTPIPTV